MTEATIKIDKPKAIVKTSASMTLNLGNYQSARIEAGIELPCEIENVPQEFDRAWAMVERQLNVKVNEIKQGTNNG